MFNNGKEARIQNKLDDLSELEDLLFQAKAELEALLDSAVPDDVRQVQDDIRAEHKPRLTMIQEKLKKAQDAIKDDVLNHRATVKGTYKQAVYSGGRVSWDTKGLLGYGVAHKKVLRFKKVGNPSVSFRNVAQPKE